ncbi:SPOR domain-containing protein [Marinobacter litoralis]|uniref:SPOR domain-containing protein n=1 Tax=Marinobacter litoralis TaxID=187981 RepID=UPI0018EB0618|nr:SPOR domain-containing protein [Marinobacter litoralis]MBJ6138794.1 SPOR domain-containing protein [Marinobacter litoralis]
MAMLNVLLWFLPERLALPTVSATVAGSLPRVASLKAAQQPKPEFEREYVCLTIGWFRSPSVVNALGRATDLEYQVKSKVASLQPLHWVLVPPQPEPDARALAEDLRSRGADVYVVTRGQYKNAVSLGMFESLEAAKKLVSEKKSENLHVTLAKFPRNRIGYALAFKVESLRETEVLQAVEAGFEGDFDFIERNACEGVATSEKNP